MTGLRIFLGAAILGGLGVAAPFTPLWLISLVTLAMSTGLVVCGSPSRRLKKLTETVYLPLGARSFGQ